MPVISDKKQAVIENPIMSQSVTTQSLAYEIAQAQGFLWRDEVTAIKKIANMLPPNPTVCIIGSGPGTTSLAIAEEKRDATIYSIDILNCTGEKMNMDNAGFGNQLTQIVGDSKEVGKTFNKSLDFLFIDGDHSAEGVRGDIAAWLSLVKDGGYVAFHDYREKVWQPVFDAVNELIVPHHEKILHIDNVIAFRYKAQRERIYTTGIPRSGNTWLNRLLSDALDSPMEAQDRSLEWFGDRGGKYAIVKTHHRDREILDGKYVYVYRDIRDVATSRYHYWGLSSIEDALKDLVTAYKPEKDQYGPYEAFTRNWWNVVPQVKYEDLFYDGIRTLQRIVRELTGIELDDHKAALAVHRQSFWGIRVRFPNRDPHAMRRGVPGDWRNHFTRNDGKLCQKLFGKLMMEQGYTHDPDWWQELSE